MLKAWKEHEIPARAPPLLRIMVRAMAQICMRKGNLRLAAGLLLAFEVLLRTGELLRLVAKNFTFHRNGKSAVIDLGLTKSGKRSGAPEQVVVNAPWLIPLLKLATDGLQLNDPLLAETPAAFRVKFKELLQSLDLEGFRFRPYSLRRGGATAAFREGMDLARLALLGRWSHQQTLLIYVNDGWVELQEIAISDKVLRNCKVLSRKRDVLLE